MELIYNTPLKIMRFIGADLMEMEDESIAKYFGKRPGRVGERLIFRKNNDPKPGGPTRLRLETLVTAINENGEGPYSVTVSKAAAPTTQPSPTTPIKKFYSPDDIKLEEEYVILEIYPEQNSFRLECGKFMIDRTSIPLRKGFEYGEEDIIVFMPISSKGNNKRKFKAVNKKGQEASVLLL